VNQRFDGRVLVRRPRAALAALAVTWLCAGTAAGAAVEATPSEECGLCHRDIYEMWRASAHSFALESMIFRQALQEARSAFGGAVAERCLGCHAPLQALTGDTRQRLKVTWEGVGCDACHSLVEVKLDQGSPRQIFDVGAIKRGPIRDAVSTGHDVAYSELHTTSRVCAGCHEYANPAGVPILTTFSEWKASDSAQRGETCQSCHMAATMADVVDPRVKRVEGAPVNVHETPGGHSLGQLHKALGVTIEGERSTEDLTLTVRLLNRGAGHAVPTGMPGRRVILELEVRTSAGQSWREERTYGRFFKDATGKAITRDAGYFAPGAEPQSDSRLMPGENREERFAFQVPAADVAFVTLKLHYEHSPLGGEEGRTRLTFLTEKRTFARGPQG
jgi:hypothetical protein